MAAKAGLANELAAMGGSTGCFRKSRSFAVRIDAANEPTFRISGAMETRTTQAQHAVDGEEAYRAVACQGDSGLQSPVRMNL